MTAGSSSQDSDRERRLCFLLDGEVVQLDAVAPTRTVLEVLREDLGRTGTKEGCAEGDCGACTVVVGELGARGQRVVRRAVNACIQLAGTLDGKELITVESLSREGAPLHPVQQALVDHHGAQCGFCTPGIVMSLYALGQSQRQVTRREVEHALSGNLCRCTGYRPIVDAALAVPSRPRDDEAEDEARAALINLRREGTLKLTSPRGVLLAPRRLDDLCELRLAHPDAVVVAGGTDVGLWVTKELRELPEILYLGDVRELRAIRRDAHHLVLGAAASLTDVALALTEAYPELSELFARFASPPIRNVATLGGNLVNASPIGDGLPPLMALDATLCLRRGTDQRELPLRDFYTGYRETRLLPGELLTAVRVPLREGAPLLRCYKVSKRFDQDISAVCAAFWIERDDAGQVREARVAYGGMAARVERAAACEAALVGTTWDEAHVTGAMGALARDFRPLDDARAGAAYRLRVAQNLLFRCWLESQAPDTPLSLYDAER